MHLHSFLKILKSCGEESCPEQKVLDSTQYAVCGQIWTLIVAPRTGGATRWWQPALNWPQNQPGQVTHQQICIWVVLRPSKVHKRRFTWNPWILISTHFWQIKQGWSVVNFLPIVWLLSLKNAEARVGEGRVPAMATIDREGWAAGSRDKLGHVSELNFH